MDDSLRCTSTSKQSGQRCRRSRSPGLDKCSIHCGLSKAERERAAAGSEARREAMEALVTFGLPPVANPYEELARIAAQQIAYKDKVGEILNRLSVEELRYAGSLRGEQTRAEIGMWQDSTRQCVSVLATLAKLAIDERLTTIRELDAQRIAAAFALSLARAHLGQELDEEVRTDFASRLRAIGTAETAEDDGQALTGVVIASSPANR